MSEEVLGLRKIAGRRDMSEQAKVVLSEVDASDGVIGDENHVGGPLILLGSDGPSSKPNMGVGHIVVATNVLHKRRVVSRVWLIAGVSVFIVGCLAVFMLVITKKPPATPMTVTSGAPSVGAIDEQEAARLQKTEGFSSVIDSVDTTKKQIYALRDGEKVAYGYSDQTQVNVGVAATPAHVDTLQAGMTVELTYNSATKLVTYIWYEK